MSSTNFFLKYGPKPSDIRYVAFVLFREKLENIWPGNIVLKISLIPSLEANDQSSTHILIIHKISALQIFSVRLSSQNATSVLVVLEVDVEVLAHDFCPFLLFFRTMCLAPFACAIIWALPELLQENLLLYTFVRISQIWFTPCSQEVSLRVFLW